MKIFTSKSLLLISFLLIQNTLFSQKSNNLLSRDDHIQYGKLYLHTDRESLFQGDSIWFKAYYLDGQTHQLISGLNNLYVELADSKGHIKNSQVLLLDNGECSGNIKLLTSLKPDNYILRAFTDREKDFGEDAFFHKILTVSETKNLSELIKDRTIKKKKKTVEIDVAFLPEGGLLLEDQLNIVGVKATDENGKSVSIQGKIIDSNGHPVSQFATNYKGMGSFHFTPRKKENYKVEIEDYPNYKNDFIKINKSGIKAEFIGKEKTDLLFQISTNSDSFRKRNYHIAFIHRAKVYFHQKIYLENKHAQIRIEQSILPAGINSFVLLDEQLNPISERLFFSHNLNINYLDIKLEKNKYETRSEVNIELFDKNDFHNQSFSKLSMAVINKDATNLNGPKLNILSCLLIDSELKGHIESSTDYFIDDKKISSESKLNLLMLTHGWSKYLWNSIPEKSINNNSNETEGLTLKGKLKRLFRKKAIADGKVTLGLFKNDEYTIYETSSDNKGRFSFNNLIFTDSAYAVINALSKNGKSTIEILLDPLFGKSPVIPKTYLQLSINAPAFMSKEIHQQKYFNDQDMKEFDLELNSILLDEVVVRRKKIERRDGYTKMYGVADYSFKVNENYSATDNVQTFLQRSIPGISFTQSSIILRQRVTDFSGQPTPSLILLDGMPLGVGDLDFVKRIPMSSVAKIEILKSAAKCVIYGSQANGGVVAIYSNKGANLNSKNSYIKGVITEKLHGYSAYKEFYSPKYTLENINTKKPDHRISLYWNPNIITKNGKASLSFFTSDDIGIFNVFVEGITSNGEICLGTAELSIDDYIQIKD